MNELKHLGKTSNQPVETIDLIEWKGERITVRLEVADFTSLCPVTGQPDFGSLVIEYVPHQHLAETKSVKLYLWRYRNERGFNEVLIDSIARDLYRQLRPHWLRVTGQFHPRGGISVTAISEHGERSYRPEG
ncbi:MAG TPA: preQ(1) synthase [Phycisphaerae bacterium]|jgi:7-cyano-7-deazaguanine reductase|nr:NADPH-dependent 7-cyano-7-deazaguanine reductase QueF [Phycisphaerae bacterium]HOB75953.1 preQ(1) synthase [Phycisphaerae bacterium]HOJ55559.1 preQ(1) synthase [Phycisphaerae bacterium]HOL27591.1 preQ(1) synthase [Phycisphaerae bacterium]HPP21833.1 preQ(1) synthase [Phycisphaerae bacterium]